MGLRMVISEKTKDGGAIYRNRELIKVNAIHKWFVDNVQNGVDDGGEYFITIEKLMQLFVLCESVKNFPELAPHLLPVYKGCFFGSYEYDKFYFQDIDETLAIIKEFIYYKVSTSDFYYTSDW